MSNRGSFFDRAGFNLSEQQKLMPKLTCTLDVSKFPFYEKTCFMHFNSLTSCIGFQVSSRVETYPILVEKSKK